MKHLIIYHGSDHIIKKPSYHLGNIHNDYGYGFYCTEDVEIGKEWSCKSYKTGFLNKYSLDIKCLNILDLTQPPFTVLNWIAILLHHRNLSAAVRTMYKSRLEFLDKHFYIDVAKYDVIIGYRADDAYFKIPLFFIQNEISIEKLEEIYTLGSLGKQIVLISLKSFERIEFISAALVEETFHDKYLNRKMIADNRFEEIRVEEMNSTKMKLEEYIKNYDKH